MWKPLRVDRSDYIIKKVSVARCHKVLLSNFVNIWGEEMTSSTLYHRCKRFNPLVEADEENLVQWTLSQISDKTDVKISIKECDDAHVMEINSKLAGVPFTIKFYLKMMTSQELYKEITLPLLLMVQQLQIQKHLLFDLLKKKDIEITEYKLEGAQLSRRSIETAAFLENQFEQSCIAIKIPGKYPAQPVQLFTQEMQSLYVDVMKKYESSKELKEVAELDADTEDSGTQSTFSDSSPEKKQKQNLKHEESLSATQNCSVPRESQIQSKEEIQPKENYRDDEYQKQEKEKRLLAKRRKEVMKKKQLNL